MSKEFTVEAWRAIRKEEGLKIDPATAEVDCIYALLLDPYGIYPKPTEECDQVARTYFARRPGSKIWVEFGDLPDNACESLWERLKFGLTQFNEICLESGDPI